MDRRAFFRGGKRPLELSCERLYMRLVDCEREGTAGPFLDRLSRQLESVRAVRMVDASWLARDELRRRLQPLLDAFRARGGRVVIERGGAASHPLQPPLATRE